MHWEKMTLTSALKFSQRSLCETSHLCEWNPSFDPPCIMNPGIVLDSGMDGCINVSCSDVRHYYREKCVFSSKNHSVRFRSNSDDFQINWSMIYSTVFGESFVSDNLSSLIIQNTYVFSYIKHIYYKFEIHSVSIYSSNNTKHHRQSMDKSFIMWFVITSSMVSHSLCFWEFCFIHR